MSTVFCLLLARGQHGCGFNSTSLASSDHWGAMTVKLNYPTRSHVGGEGWSFHSRCLGVKIDRLYSLSLAEWIHVRGNTVKPRYLATVGSTRNIGARRGGEVTKTGIKYLGEIRSQWKLGERRSWRANEERANEVWTFSRYFQLFPQFFSFITTHRRDRQTDGQRDGHRWSILEILVDMISA
jgi:hypothetical protein